MNVNASAKVVKRTGKTPRIKVSVRLDSNIHKRITQIAEADKRSFSQVIELILSRYLGEGGQKAALAHKSGERDDRSLNEHSLLTQLAQAGPHGSWSQHDAYDAAASLQALLDEHQPTNAHDDSHETAAL